MCVLVDIIDISHNIEIETNTAKNRKHLNVYEINTELPLRTHL